MSRRSLLLNLSALASALVVGSRVNARPLEPRTPGEAIAQGWTRFECNGQTEFPVYRADGTRAEETWIGFSKGDYRVNFLVAK